MLKKWKKVEKQVLTKHGARTSLNSGATWHQKGDGRSGDWCIEVKSTTKGLYRLTPVVVRKMYRDAGAMQRDPMLIIHFHDENRDVVVVPGWAIGEELDPLEGNSIDPWVSEASLRVDDRDFIVLSEANAKSRGILANSADLV